MLQRTATKLRHTCATTDQNTVLEFKAIRSDMHNPYVSNTFEYIFSHCTVIEARACLAQSQVNDHLLFPPPNIGKKIQCLSEDNNLTLSQTTTRVLAQREITVTHVRISERGHLPMVTVNQALSSDVLYSVFRQFSSMHSL